MAPTTTAHQTTALAKRAIVARLAEIGFIVRLADVTLSGGGSHARVFAGSYERAQFIAADVPGAFIAYPGCKTVQVPRGDA